MTEAEGQKQRVLRFDTAEEVFAKLPQIKEDMTARPNGAAGDPIAFIKTLLASPTPEEAITFSAYVLPRRHAVWWGHECLKKGRAKLSETDEALLDLAAAWVRNPNEDTRYAVLDAAMEAPEKTAAVWVALAAGWSGGSLVPRNLQPVPPAEHLTSRAINGGLLLTLARADLSEREATLKNFVNMALVIARGT